eukprot:gene7895-7316_t
MKAARLVTGPSPVHRTSQCLLLSRGRLKMGVLVGLFAAAISEDQAPPSPTHLPPPVLRSPLALFFPYSKGGACNGRASLFPTFFGCRTHVNCDRPTETAYRPRK